MKRFKNNITNKKMTNKNMESKIISTATHPGLRIIEHFGNTGKQFILRECGHTYNFAGSLPTHIIYVCGKMAGLLMVVDGFYRREIVNNSIILTQSTEEEYLKENPKGEGSNP